MVTNGLEPGTAQEADRLRVLLLTPELLLGLFSAGRHAPYEVTEDPVPADARAVRAFYDGRQHAIGVVLWSSEFEMVEPGQPIPELSPACRRVERENR